MLEAMNIVISFYLAHPWALIPTVYLIMSFVAFVAYAVDKRAAKRGEWRTPESTLHTLELLCGWPGAWLAQRLLRHKSVKTSFRIVFFMMVALNLAVLAYVIYGMTFGEQSFSIRLVQSNIPVRKYNQWANNLGREIVFRASR
ncbi:MAG: DUF1294 domain-containing protein [Kiritimatiellae bacterium]|nr:DUF1294 domain-containing protein [Kiritimatiellia bacterium]